MVELKGTTSDEVEIYVSVDNIYEALSEREAKELCFMILANSSESGKLVDEILDEYVDKKYAIEFFDIGKEDLE